MTDTPDSFARSTALAVQAALMHLLKHLQDKGVLSPEESHIVLSDAKADFNVPMATDYQIQASAILQVMIEGL